MLAAPTDSEREVLGDIGWQRNEVVLHSDPRWLPERQRAGQLELSPERRGSGPGLRHLQHEYSPGLPAARRCSASP